MDLLTDNAKSVSSSALNCLRKCGQQYEEEHADDIIEKRQYGIDGDDRINLEKVLPFPFIERPRIGEDFMYCFFLYYFSLISLISSPFPFLPSAITDVFIHLFILFLHLFISSLIFLFTYLLVSTDTSFSLI